MARNYLEIVKEDFQKTFSNNEKLFETIRFASGFAKRQVLYSLANRDFSHYQKRLAVALLRKDIEPTFNRYEIEQATKFYAQQIEKIDTLIKETLPLSGILTEAQIASLHKTAYRNANRELVKVCMKTASIMITLEAQKLIPRYNR